MDGYKRPDLGLRGRAASEFIFLTHTLCVLMIVVTLLILQESTVCPKAICIVEDQTRKNSPVPQLVVYHISRPRKVDTLAKNKYNDHGS